MKNNLNSIDRTLRLLLASIIGFLFFTQTIHGTSGIMLLIVGTILMLTSFAGYSVPMCRWKSSVILSRVPDCIAITAGISVFSKFRLSGNNVDSIKQKLFSVQFCDFREKN